MSKEPAVPKKSLEELLTKHPFLKAKLIEALDTDHFFITTSCQLRKNPEDPHDPHDLQHSFHDQNYPARDVINTLSHIERDFIAKVLPIAMPDKPEGGEIY